MDLADYTFDWFLNVDTSRDYYAMARELGNLVDFTSLENEGDGDFQTEG